MNETLQPVNPYQQVTDQSQPPVDQSQPGSAEYMNSEAANPPPLDPLDQHINHFLTNQHEPAALLTAKPPEHLAPIFKQRAGENLTNDMEKQKAISNIQQMDPNQLASVLKEKTTGGSWTKAIIYGILGMENSAQAEAAKLGIGKYQTVQGQDGNAYLVKMSVNGTPLEGFSAGTGVKLNPNELINVIGQGNALKGQQTHTGKMQDMKTGEVYYEQTSPQGIKLVDTNGKRYAGPTSNLRPFGIGSDLTTQLQLSQMKRQQNFIGQTANERIKSFHELNNERTLANMQPLTPTQMGLTNTGELIGQQQQVQIPTAQTANQPIAQTANQPIAQTANQPIAPQSVIQNATPTVNQPAIPSTSPIGIPVTTTPTAGMSGADLKAQRKAKEEAGKVIGEKTAENVAGAAVAANTVSDIDHAIDLLKTGKHNIGPMVSGTLTGGGPLGQAIGSQLNTEGARNTKMIMDTVRSVGGAMSQAVIKGHLTNQELQFMTENKPNETSDPEYTKYWLEKAKKSLENVQKYSQEQTTTGGRANNPVTNKHKPGTKENPIKIN